MADENDPNRPEEPTARPPAAEPGADSPKISEPSAPAGDEAAPIEAAIEETVEAEEATPVTAAPEFAREAEAEIVEAPLSELQDGAAEVVATLTATPLETSPMASERAETAEYVTTDAHETDEPRIDNVVAPAAGELGSDAGFVAEDAPAPVESESTPAPEGMAAPAETTTSFEAAPAAEPEENLSATAQPRQSIEEIRNLETLPDPLDAVAAPVVEAIGSSLEAAELEQSDADLAAAPEAAEPQAAENVAAEKTMDDAAPTRENEWEVEQRQDPAPLEETPPEPEPLPVAATSEPPAVQETVEVGPSLTAALEPESSQTGAASESAPEAPPAVSEQQDQMAPAASLKAASDELEAAPENEAAEAFVEQPPTQSTSPIEQAPGEAMIEAGELVRFDEEVPEAVAAEHAEITEVAPQMVGADDAVQLPPNYFQAAGDPDEPSEPPPAFWNRVGSRLGDFRVFVARSLGPFGSAARKVGGGMWRGVRDIKHPRNVREVAVWGGWAAAAFTTLIVGFFVFVTWGMPSTDDLWEARNGQSITFLDRNGNVILREGAQNAPPVDLQSLPPFVAQAFVAIEDRRFYQHWGIDPEGMMRAGAQNIRAGRVVQGGSTITQQLAKNLFLTNERSWRRKAQEIAMAVWLETKFTKEEILALYLSRVYFGAGAYGIEAAAERYFDRPARELTLLQSAMIAGLVKAPSRLNPANQDIASARTRAEIVLQEMVSLNFISDTERQAALNEDLVVSRRNPAGVLSYYRDWIDPLLNDVIGTQRDDFIIETTIDIQAQRAGADAVEAVLAEQGESRRASQAALLSMDDDGEVLAMVGGRDYDTSQFNRATQARRQPGSSFKYFIYLAAMESGLTPWSIRNDAPITIHIEGQPDWSPGNYHEEYNGPVELARAFSQSYNMVAIRVANEVGGQHVIDVARRLGVSSELHNYHSLALGAQEVTLLEMTQAYGAMASQGYRVQAHGVSRIRRSHDDETMWSWRQTGGPTRVVEERPLRYMNYMMNRVVESGTGTVARISGRQIGGKTGTANDYRDAWFVGFTPGIVTGVWVGNDDHRIAMARVTGGQLPANIWARFMPTALRNVPIRELQMPGPDDYEVGRPDPISPTLTAVGAPLGNAPPTAGPNDAEDRSLDFGPEG